METGLRGLSVGGERVGGIWGVTTKKRESVCLWGRQEMGDIRMRRKEGSGKRKNGFCRLVCQKAAAAMCTALLGGIFGAGNHLAYGAEPPAAAVFNYEELGTLIKEHCPQVEMERRQYEERMDRLKDAREELLKTRRALREEASDREKEGDALLDAADSLDRQIRQAGNASSRMALRQMEDTMTWTAQNLMGTYHSLEAEKLAANARAEVQKRRFEEAQNSKSLGDGTAQAAEEARQKWQLALNEGERMTAEQERVRQELLRLTGFSVSDPALPGPMPQPDPSRVPRRIRKRLWEIIISCEAAVAVLRKPTGSFIKNSVRPGRMRIRCLLLWKPFLLRYIHAGQNGKQPGQRKLRPELAGRRLPARKNWG